MKTIIRSILLLLLLLSSSVFASGRGIFLQLSDSRGNVDPVVKQQIQQLLGDAIANGTVDSMVTYNQGLQFNNQLAMCADSSGNATRFKRLFENLRDIKARASASYQVKMQAHCSKDTTLVCLSGFAGCVNSNFNSAQINEYIASQQFADALADISPSRAVMELKLTKNIDVSSPSEIGIPNATKHCSTIAATGTAADGSATITCTVIGNAAISGKVITLTRSADGNNYFMWNCDSDAYDRYKLSCLLFH